MANKQPQRIRTITEFHRLNNLEKPEHPLVSVINFESIRHFPADGSISFTRDFYSIGLKKNFKAKMKYGQQQYDFHGGIMTFMAPGQVLRIEMRNDDIINHSGWLLLFHPDFLLHTSLAKGIKKYEYFGYAVNEALHLSPKEEAVIVGIIQNIEQEYRSPIDHFSQGVIIAQVELLLTYAERFYHRQFITRKVSNHQILDQLDDLLDEYLNSEALAGQGLPTVGYIAEKLHLSPGYLSAMLKTLTGQSTQHLMYDKLVEIAKERLSTTRLTISEIAYELGFDHSQSFSRLFKSKTNLSPLDFRKNFN
jgi:AraC family transcriptional regulator, transcriptional activator of pobA